MQSIKSMILKASKIQEKSCRCLLLSPCLFYNFLYTYMMFRRAEKYINRILKSIFPASTFLFFCAEQGPKIELKFCRKKTSFCLATEVFMRLSFVVEDTRYKSEILRKFISTFFCLRVCKTRTKLILSLSCTLESSVVFIYPLLKFFVLDFKFQATYLVFDFIFSSLFGPEFHLQLGQAQLVTMQSHHLTIHGGCQYKMASIDHTSYGFETKLKITYFGQG